MDFNIFKKDKYDILLNELSDEPMAPVPIITMLPYLFLANDNTVGLSNGSIMQSVRVMGLDSLTSSDEKLERIQEIFANIIRGTADGFEIYVHKISKVILDEDYPRALKSNDFASAVDSVWKSHLVASDLRDKNITISIVKRASIAQHISKLGILDEESRLQAREDNIDELDKVVGQLISGLSDLEPKILSAKKGELFGFLSSIFSGKECPVFPSKGLSIIGDVIVSDRVTFYKDHFTLTEGPNGKMFGATRMLKEYPESSWVTVFDELPMGSDYVITQSFTGVSDQTAETSIKNRMHIIQQNSLGSATAYADMQNALDQVSSHLNSWGNHQLTITLYDRDLKVLKKRLADLDGVATYAEGAKLIEDRANKKANFFSQFPGNASKRVRPALINDQNFADLASLHRSSSGKPRDVLPWKEPLLALPTIDGSLFNFSFHSKGKQVGEPTAAHSIIFGKTGGGKSLFASMLMAAAKRVNARIFVLDYRNGLEMQVRALGGNYSSVEVGTKTGLNPLWTETDEAGIVWLSDWVQRVILNVQDDKELTSEQKKSITDICRTLAKAEDPRLRNWDEFAAQFTRVGDNNDLRDRVEEWTKGQKYGWVFGETLEDTFSLDGDVIGFDLTTVLDSQSVRERMGVLSYIFRRIERKIEDKRPSILFVDEAWKAVNNAYFGEILEGYLATARRKNLAVILMTQNPKQITSSAVGDGIFAHIPTQIHLQNEGVQPSDFEALRLTEKEIALVMQPNIDRRMLIKDDIGTTLINGDFSALGNLLHVLGGGAGGEEIVGTDYRDKLNFWKKAL